MWETDNKNIILHVARSMKITKRVAWWRVSEVAEGRVPQVASGKGFSRERLNDEKEPLVLCLGKWRSANVGRSRWTTGSWSTGEACGREAGEKAYTRLGGAMQAMVKKLNFYSKCHVGPLADFRASTWPGSYSAKFSRAGLWYPSLCLGQGHTSHVLIPANDRVWQGY